MSVTEHTYDEMKKAAINLLLQLLDSPLINKILKEGDIQTFEDLMKAIKNLPEENEIKIECMKLEKLPAKAREQVLNDANESLSSYYCSLDEAETYLEELNEQLINLNNNIINQTKHSKKHKERLRKKFEKLLEIIKE